MIQILLGQVGEYKKVSLLTPLFTALEVFMEVLIPFATSGSSGMGGTNQELAGSCKGARLVEGRRFSANAKAAELEAWAGQF